MNSFKYSIWGICFYLKYKTLKLHCKNILILINIWNQRLKNTQQDIVFGIHKE